MNLPWVHFLGYNGIWGILFEKNGIILVIKLNINGIRLA